MAGLDSAITTKNRDRPRVSLGKMYTGQYWLYLNLADGDLNSFLPAWAAYRGILATPNVAMPHDARRTHLGLSPHIVRLSRNADAVALEKELAIELRRRERYPDAISRLNCIYCWPDEATAKIAPKFWSKQGRHFNSRYLVEIGVSTSKKPTIVDTRWIDHFVFLSSQPLEEIGADWIDHYWQGKIFPWRGHETIPELPLMECLIDGTALVWGTELRMEGLAIVERIAPEAVGILEKGRLGVDLCTRFGGTVEWRLGQITPMIFTDPARSMLIIKMPILLDEALAEAVNTGVAEAKIKPEEINIRALQVFQRDTLRLPDLRPLEVSLAWVKNYPPLQLRLNQVLTAFFLERGGDVEAARKFHEQQS